MTPTSIATLLEALAARIVTASQFTPGRFLLQKSVRPAVYNLKALRTKRYMDKGEEFIAKILKWDADSRTFECNVEGAGEHGEVFSVSKEDVLIDQEPLDVAPDQASHWDLLDHEPIQATWIAALNKRGAKVKSSREPAVLTLFGHEITFTLKEIAPTGIVVTATSESGWSLERALVRNMPVNTLLKRFDRWFVTAAVRLDHARAVEENEAQSKIDSRNPKKTESKYSAVAAFSIESLLRDTKLDAVYVIGAYAGEIKRLANVIKNYHEGVEDDFLLVAKIFSEHIPKGATIVPAPSSKGTNHSCRILAEMTAKRISGATMVEAVIRREPMESLSETRKKEEEEAEELKKINEGRRKQGLAPKDSLHPPLTPEEREAKKKSNPRIFENQRDSMKRVRDLAGRDVWIIDNVTTSGLTLYTVARVLGSVNCKGIVMAIARGATTLTYCKNVKTVGSAVLAAIKQAKIQEQQDAKLMKQMEKEEKEKLAKKEKERKEEEKLLKKWEKEYQQEKKKPTPPTTPPPQAASFRPFQKRRW